MTNSTHSHSQQAGSVTGPRRTKQGRRRKLVYQGVIAGYLHEISTHHLTVTEPARAS